MHRGELEEAVILLREKGVALTAEEAKNWEIIYEKLLQIKPVEFIYDNQLNTLNEAMARLQARKKNDTTKTPTTKEEKGPDYEKYWEDIISYENNGKLSLRKSAESVIMNAK